MDYPDDDTMRVMTAFTCMKEFCVYANGIMAISTKYGSVAVTGEQIDELCGRGWIELTDRNTVIVTVNGHYWAMRWLKPRIKKRIH